MVLGVLAVLEEGVSGVGIVGGVADVSGGGEFFGQVEAEEGDYE